MGCLKAEMIPKNSCSTPDWIMPAWEYDVIISSFYDYRNDAGNN